MSAKAAKTTKTVFEPGGTQTLTEKDQKQRETHTADVSPKITVASLWPVWTTQNRVKK